MSRLTELLEDAVGATVPTFAFDDVVARADSVHRLRRTSTAIAIVAVVSVGIVALALSLGHKTSGPAVNVTPTSVALPATGSPLSFRVVRESMPYGTPTSATVTSGSDAPSSCGGGRLVTPPRRRAAGAPIVLADREKIACYVLGPTLLTMAHVDSADAVGPPPFATSSGWEVVVQLTNDDFVTKVAKPYLERQIAIILDGVVQSAPAIQGLSDTSPLLDARHLVISGAYLGVISSGGEYSGAATLFGKAAAGDIAARIDPSSRSRTALTAARPLDVAAEIKAAGFGCADASNDPLPHPLRNPITGDTQATASCTIGTDAVAFTLFGAHPALVRNLPLVRQGACFVAKTKPDQNLSFVEGTNWIVGAQLAGDTAKIAKATGGSIVKFDCSG